METFLQESSLILLNKGKTVKRFSKIIPNFRTYAMIKPDAYLHIGKIVSGIERDGFTLGNIKMTRMTVNDAAEFYGEHKVLISNNDQ